MTIRLQVDVGYGDTIVPTAQCVEFPSLLTKSGPVLRAYTPETVVAEKFHAIALLGMANSRMKDYFDIWMLSRNFSFDGWMLLRALENTFAKRGMRFPDSEPIGLTEEFSRNESKRMQWRGFVKRRKRQESIPDLQEIVAINKAFLMPVVCSKRPLAAHSMTWTASGGWMVNEGVNHPREP